MFPGYPRTVWVVRRD